MEITIDNLQDWQQGFAPHDLMDNIVGFLTVTPNVALQVNYADGTQHSYLRKINNQIVQIGFGEGYVEGKPIYTIPE